MMAAWAAALLAMVFYMYPLRSTAAAAPAAPAQGKRGLSGLQGCDDARALGLGAAWHYGWNLWPASVDAGGNSAPPGTHICSPPMAAEFVPMFWGYWGKSSVTGAVWGSFKADWGSVGVKAIMGFNEPDNPGQSNLTPQQAALGYTEIESIAQQFDPPLTLVGPGMTHWDENGGSPWLDQFLGNLSVPLAARIEFLAQHDYSGDAAGIVAKAGKAFAKYKRKVWLTEFAVGHGKDRATNDAFMQKVLPLLDGAESVARYSWYSTRDAPGSWVNASNLLPVDVAASDGWSKHSGMACAPDGMTWINAHVNARECQTQVLDDLRCAEPKTAVYQSGSPKSCYCATTRCNLTHDGWQDTYVHRGAPPPPWAKTEQTTCAEAELLLLPTGWQPNTVAECQAIAETNGSCASTPTKTVVYAPPDETNSSCWTKSAGTACTEMLWLSTWKSAQECLESTLDNAGCVVPKIAVYESGDVKNCYCSSTPNCQRNGSSWQIVFDLHGKLPAKPAGKPYPKKSYQICKETCQCRSTETCTSTPSSWQDTYVQPTVKALSVEPTSTGKLYAVVPRMQATPSSWQGLMGVQPASNSSAIAVVPVGPHPNWALPCENKCNGDTTCLGFSVSSWLVAAPRSCRLYSRIDRLEEVPCGGRHANQSAAQLAAFFVKPGSAIPGPAPYQQWAGQMPLHRAQTAAQLTCNGNFTVCTDACNADALCVGINLLGCAPEDPGEHCWTLHAAAVPSLIPNVLDHACYYQKPGTPAVPAGRPLKQWTCATSPPPGCIYPYGCKFGQSQWSDGTAEFNCKMRKLAWDFGRQARPDLGLFEDLYFALGLNHDCLAEVPPQIFTAPDRSPAPRTFPDARGEQQTAFHVDYAAGSDSNSGSLQKPFKTIQAAVDAAADKPLATVNLHGGASPGPQINVSAWVLCVSWFAKLEFWGAQRDALPPCRCAGAFAATAPRPPAS